MKKLDGRTRAGKRAAKFTGLEAGDWGYSYADRAKVTEANAHLNKMLKAHIEDISICKQIGGDHYIQKNIQPWAAMEAWMTPEQFAGFLRGNAIKYLARADDKGGIEDIKKAQHYIEKLVEFMEGCAH